MKQRSPNSLKAEQEKERAQVHDARLNVEAAKLLGIARGISDISGCFGVQGTPVGLILLSFYLVTGLVEPIGETSSACGPGSHEPITGRHRLFPRCVSLARRNAENIPEIAQEKPCLTWITLDNNIPVLLGQRPAIFFKQKFGRRHFFHRYRRLSVVPHQLMSLMSSGL